MKRLLPLISCLLISVIGHGQSPTVPLNQDYYHLVDRYEILQKDFSTNLFTSAKPYTREAVAAFADSLRASGRFTSAQDRFNLQFLLNDNWEFTENEDVDSKKPIFKHFYQKKTDALFVENEDLVLHANPVYHLTVGNDSELDKRPFEHARGLEVRSVIGGKLATYFYATENQLRFPEYVEQYTQQRQAIPGQGFYKNLDPEDPESNGKDFFEARGYILFKPFKFMDLQFGHDRHFIGNGYRSLILSDFANNYTFLRLNTKVWKFNYTNIFAEMVAVNDRLIPDDAAIPNPKKYMAFHHLSWNVTDNFNIGVFESVTFARQDSVGGNGFDWAYLNPMIFYRSMEHELGDPDNIILGADMKWNLWNRLQLYGQFIIDEFVGQEFAERSGSWRNKQALQAGMKYINVAGIDQLDLQLEFNAVRPFTYTHFRRPEDSNYQHYDQPLAHPLGANFYEFISVWRYQPIPKLQLRLKTFYSVKGEDDAEGRFNYGGDIFKDYNTRGDAEATSLQETGYDLAGGIEATRLMVDFSASYQLRHNLFLEFQHIYRDLASDDAARELTTHYTNVGIRWNMWRRNYDF